MYSGTCQVCGASGKLWPAFTRMLCATCLLDLDAYAKSFGEPVEVRYNRWLELVGAGRRQAS